MLRRAEFTAKYSLVTKLTASRKNAVGDWLYYHLHKDEVDCVTNRQVPIEIGTVFVRQTHINWHELFESNREGH